jgi:hypothetical protein
METSDAALLLLLHSLETELHNPSARGDPARLNAILHHDFREFGRSGTAYSKLGILSLLASETQYSDVVADCFKLRRLGEAAALLTYRSAHRLADGTLDRHTLRVSVWEQSTLGWRMSFHQGTPTAPYEPSQPDPATD